MKRNRNSSAKARPMQSAVEWENDDLGSAGRRVHGRPTLARKEEMRSAILSAAMVEFANLGFHGGSIAGIAQRANVTRATIYKQFSSKEAMLIKICEHSSGRLRSEIEDAIDPKRPVWEVLHDVALCFYKEGGSVDSRSISRILVMEADRFPLLRKEFDERRRFALEPLSRYFATLCMGGQMAVEDEFQAALQFMHLVTSTVEYLFHEDRSPQFQERWIKSAVCIFLHGAYRSPRVDG